MEAEGFLDEWLKTGPERAYRAAAEGKPPPGTLTQARDELEKLAGAAEVGAQRPLEVVRVPGDELGPEDVLEGPGWQAGGWAGSVEQEKEEHCTWEQLWLLTITDAMF